MKLRYALLALLLIAGTAFAASVHLKGGAKAEPAFVDGGIVLNTSGALSGLGNGDVLITVKAWANAMSTCTNKGGNAAPGQNPAPVDVSGAQSIPASEIKNGNTPFNVTTDAPVTPIPGAPGCENPNWSQTIDDLAFTSATIFVEQGGEVVFVADCTFDPATVDGAVDAGDVVCN